VFELNLPIYQGPLEVLLELIERQELDITVVSLVQVTDQFLEYMRTVEHLDPEALAEFVSIGSRLIYMKSAALLPRPIVEPAEEADGEALAQMLIEYRRFREAAAALRQLEASGRQVYPRLAPPPSVPPPHGLDAVTIDRLLDMFRAALQRRPPPEAPAVVERQEITVEQKIEQVLAALRAHRSVPFSSLIADATRRVEVVITLLALLELIKAGRIAAQQDMLFGEIVIVAIEPARRARRRSPTPPRQPASQEVMDLDRGQHSDGFRR
jgi:segregation and condensation protein A